MLWRVLVVLAALLAPAVPAQAQDDRGRLTRFLEENLSAAGREVRIEGFRGALSSRAQIDRMTIADDAGVWLTLAGVVLDWNRLAVLRGNIAINELSAREIVLSRPPVAAPGERPPTPEAQPFALPDLPVAVDIGRISAARIALGTPVLGEPVEGTLDASLRLAGGEGRGRLSILRQDFGPAGSVQLDASFSNASRMLVVALEAGEDPGGIAARLIGLPGQPAVRLSVQGAGPIANFAADVRLQTDGQDRLAGRITLSEPAPGARRFAADLGGDLAPLFLPAYAEFFGPEVRLVAEGLRDPAGRLDLSRLSVAARALTLDGSLVLAADGLPERFALAGRLGLPDGAPVLVPLAGASPTRVAAADLSAAYDAAEGEGWSLRGTVQGVDRPDLAISRLALDGSGRIARRAGQDALPVFGGTVDFTAEGLAPADAGLARALGSVVTGRATVSRQAGEDALRVGQLRLDGEDYGLSAQGRVEGLTSGFALSGEAEVQARDLSRFAGLAGQPLGGALRGRIEGSGSPLGGAFDVAADVAGTDLRSGVAEADNLLRGPSRIVLSARRDETGVALRDLTVTAGPARLAARGTLATAGSDLSAEFDFPDLSVLGSPWGGAMAATARLTGTPADADLTLDGTGRDLRIGVAEADNLLRGPSRITLSARRNEGGIVLRDLGVTAGPARLAARGTLAAAGSDLSAEFDFPDLAVLGGPWGGGLAATARLTGTTEDAGLTLTGTARDLRTGVAEADGLLRGATALDLSLTRQGQRIGILDATLANPQARVQARGHYDPAGSDLTAAVTVADLRALGGAYRGALSADLRAAGTPQAGTLTLTGSARDLAVGQAEADRLLRGETALRLSLAAEGARLRVNEARLANPQVTVAATGVVEGAQRRVDLTARLADLGLIVPEFPGPLTVAGEVREDGAGYAVDLRAQGPGQIAATARGRVARGFGSADLRLAGSAQAALANAFLGSRAVSGAVTFDLGLGGPFALGSLSGPVRLTGGRFSDPDLPFALDAIAGTATLGGGRARIDAAAAVSTGGRVSAAGSLGMAAPYPADLSIALAGVRVRDPALYETTLDGALRLSGPAVAGGVLSGRIDLRDTELRVPSTGLGGAGDIPDLRHLAEPADVRRTRAYAGLLGGAGGGAGAGAAGPGLGLDLTIAAPNRVFLRGRGLDAELGGAFRIQGTTAAVVPSGALELIRGRLDILGQRLVLTTARLDLQGSLIPTLEVVAANESDGISSFVRIEGPADEPEITFSSAPALPQEEVLARLLFGRGLQNISAFQAAQLAVAVATLAGRGGVGIVGRLRQGFGLDDLDVSTGATGETTLRAGKYISERVYTEVEVGQAGQSRINLNLDVRPGVTVKGRVGTDGEAGLGVFLERDY